MELLIMTICKHCGLDILDAKCEPIKQKAFKMSKADYLLASVWSERFQYSDDEPADPWMISAELMKAIGNYVSRRIVAVRAETSGSVLTKADGSEWFHSYDGTKPVKRK